jgi:hypothetical protein
MRYLQTYESLSNDSLVSLVKELNNIKPDAIIYSSPGRFTFNHPSVKLIKLNFEEGDLVSTSKSSFDNSNDKGAHLLSMGNSIEYLYKNDPDYIKTKNIKKLNLPIYVVLDKVDKKKLFEIANKITDSGYSVTYYMFTYSEQDWLKPENFSVNSLRYSKKISESEIVGLKHDFKFVIEFK